MSAAPGVGEGGSFPALPSAVGPSTSIASDLGLVLASSPSPPLSPPSASLVVSAGPSWSSMISHPSPSPSLTLASSTVPSWSRIYAHLVAPEPEPEPEPEPKPKPSAGSPPLHFSDGCGPPLPSPVASPASCAIPAAAGNVRPSLTVICAALAGRDASGGRTAERRAEKSMAVLPLPCEGGARFLVRSVPSGLGSDY